MEETNGERMYGSYPGFPKFDEGVVPHFQDVSEEDKRVVINYPHYQLIEKLIIAWSNDGTKTAGTLARRISKLINEK